jgi:hypothetical protein
LRWAWCDPFGAVGEEGVEATEQGD